MTWNIFDSGTASNYPLTGLPRFCAKRGFEGIEISDRQLTSWNQDSIRAFGAESQLQGMGIILDIGCDLTSNHLKYFQEERDHVKQMIRIAQEIGAEGVRIWLGGQSLSIQKLYYRKMRTIFQDGTFEKKNFKRSPTVVSVILRSNPISRLVRWMGHRVSSQVFFLEKKIQNAVLSLKEIMRSVEGDALFVAVENHWGISSDPENLLSVIHSVGFRNLGTCVDFTNFPKRVNRVDGIRCLAPYAFMAHAKRDLFIKDFNRRDIDFQNALSVLKSSGFDGIIAAEYDGPGNGLDECLEIRKKIQELWEGRGRDGAVGYPSI
ncbi:MAG: hypothetical protein AB1659_03950 [Thermodesulfobacteriota bacterium]